MTAGTKLVLVLITLGVGVIGGYYIWIGPSTDDPVPVQAPGEDDVLEPPGEAGTGGNGPELKPMPVFPPPEERPEPPAPDLITLPVDPALDETESATVGDDTSTSAPADDEPVPGRPLGNLPVVDPGRNGDEISGKNDPEPPPADPDEGVEPATEEPSPAPPPATTDPAPLAPPRYETWTVKANESMFTIAQAWFGDANKWDLIARANPLVDPQYLQIGQELRMPPRDAKREPVPERDEGESIIYVVRPGDSLSKIARAYYSDGGLWKVIFDANQTLLKDGANSLRPGMKLTIPPPPAKR
jgi:nucleoid-associated protein YgaU